MWSKADFGQAIVFIADKIGLNQKQLASALKLEPKTVSAWKRGDRSPYPRAMKALPGVLTCSMAEIEEVAAYHAMWRQRMKRKGIQAPAAGLRKNSWAEAIHETDYGVGEDREREIGRLVGRLFYLLQSDFNGRPGRRAAPLPEA